MNSLYYIVITMITIGYGDIRPVNTAEKLFMIVICLVSCAIFAYTLNSIGQIIEKITQSKEKFRKELVYLQNYMNTRNLSQDTQMKVKKFFEFKHAEELNSNVEGEKMFGQLTGDLKQQVQQEMYKMILNKAKFLKLNFSNQFIDSLSLTMKEAKFGPDEVIFSQNKLQNKLYFIISGDVQLQLLRPNDQPTKIDQLTSGQVLGALSFISGKASEYNARSLNMVTLAYVQSEDFYRELAKYQDDCEKFHQLKDNLDLYQFAQGLDVNCQLCGLYTHQSLYKCPYLFLNQRADLIIKKYNRDDQCQCQRTPFPRKEVKF